MLLPSNLPKELMSCQVMKRRKAQVKNAYKQIIHLNPAARSQMWTVYPARATNFQRMLTCSSSGLLCTRLRNPVTVCYHSW